MIYTLLHITDEADLHLPPSLKQLALTTVESIRFLRTNNSFSPYLYQIQFPSQNRGFPLFPSDDHFSEEIYRQRQEGNSQKLQDPSQLLYYLLCQLLGEGNDEFLGRGDGEESLNALNALNALNSDSLSVLDTLNALNANHPLNQMNENEMNENEMNESKDNQVNENEMNQVNENEMNQVNENEMNQMNENEMNQVNENEMNQMNENEMNQMNENEMNQMNENEMNQMNEQSEMSESNKSNDLNSSNESNESNESKPSNELSPSPSLNVSLSSNDSNPIKTFQEENESLLRLCERCLSLSDMDSFHAPSEVTKEETFRDEETREGSEEVLEDSSIDLLSLIKSKKLISQEDDEDFIENDMLDESLESRRRNVKGTMDFVLGDEKQST